jgi:DNA-binding GntR family transcriptional regulator
VSEIPSLLRPQPPYAQIVAYYRDLILRGELRDGDMLPTVREIAATWKVAHATANKVVSTLKAQRLVASRGGRAGTVVTSAADRTPRDRLEAVHRTGRIYPPGEHARIVAAELVTAPEHVADALDLEPGSQVIRRHRITLRGDGDEPVSVSTSWFHPDLATTAPALLETERLPQGTPGYIEQQTGRHAVICQDHITAGLATAEVARELGITDGAPVLLGRSWFREADGSIIEFGEYVSGPTRWATYEFALDAAPSVA